MLPRGTRDPGESRGAAIPLEGKHALGDKVSRIVVSIHIPYRYDKIPMTTSHPVYQEVHWRR